MDISSSSIRWRFDDLFIWVKFGICIEVFSDRTTAELPLLGVVLLGKYYVDILAMFKNFSR